MTKYEHPWRRGAFVAQVTGERPGGGPAIAFETGTPVKSRGVLRFDLAPGYYAAREGKVAPWRFLAVSDLTVEPLGATDALRAHIGKAAAGPRPGEPGSWFGTVCECGSPVEWYTPAGFPICDDCHAATGKGKK